MDNQVISMPYWKLGRLGKFLLWSQANGECGRPGGVILIGRVDRGGRLDSPADREWPVARLAANTAVQKSPSLTVTASGLLALVSTVMLTVSRTT